MSVAVVAEPGRVMNDASWSGYPPRTSEDRAVWRTMIDRIAERLDAAPRRHPVYRQAFGQILAWRDVIPEQEEINAWLRPTGWSVTYVDGYVPVELYQRLQAERIFPISWRLRRLRDLDHSASPDFVHDVLGHLPMLFEPGYSDLVQEWSRLGLSAPPTETDRAAAAALAGLMEAFERPSVNPQEIAGRTAWLQTAQAAAVAGASRHFQFETFYTWAIEFGVLGSVGENALLFGAAALSSPGELARLAGGGVALEPFAAGAVGRPVNYTRYQDTMFVARSFGEYAAALRAI
jgi:phenylalanine-4-hydroxylase